MYLSYKDDLLVGKSSVFARLTIHHSMHVTLTNKLEMAIVMPSQYVQDLSAKQNADSVTNLSRCRS